MKEIHIHKNEKGNLCSIKPVDDNYSDKQYLISLIEKLYSKANGLLYVEVSRSNYDVAGIIDLLKDKSLNINNLAYDSDFFQLIFDYEGEEIRSELLNILSDIWFAFQHSCICFFVNKEKRIIPKRQSWLVLTSMLPCYIMFRGAEEDVIWIGKSTVLSF